VDNEAAGGTVLVILAGQRAAPYLLRQRRWDDASPLLEQVINRDQSPATVAAVLPLLRQIAQATAETERELQDAGILANTLLKAGRWAEAEAQFREQIPRAVEQGAFLEVSLQTGHLINLLKATGRAEEALDWVERTQDFTRRAGLGPWTPACAPRRRPASRRRPPSLGTCGRAFWTRAIPPLDRWNAGNRRWC
jgi:tetratricopeptide (TPR) repeat protein